MSKLVLDRLYFERDDMPLFGDVSATCSAGDIVQVAGPNGCGKTTLLRMIAGLLQPTLGQVSYAGHAVSSLAFKSSLLYLGHHVGVKLTMTPIENLSWYMALNGRKNARKSSPISHSELKGALDRVGLLQYLDTPCYSLSAGQQRRVALARLYLSDAPIWVLDEPFTAIDKQGVAELESRIEQHASSGGVVLLTTHQRWNAQKIQVLDLEQYKGRSADV